MNNSFPPNATQVSQRALALGAIPTPNNNTGDVKRFLDDGDIVEFKLGDVVYCNNAEFCINNNPKWRIWFSQLNKVYIAESGRDIHVGHLILKNEGDKLLPNISSNEFESLVRGRRFKVSVTKGLYSIDQFSEKLRCFENYGQICDYIFDALDEERYSDVSGLTKSQPLYCLVEV